ncbi:hypothetical protein [Saccharopolyspora thermophila]|nr:hypothetical protein [Saccharopolyspora subtropica]
MTDRTDTDAQTLLTLELAGEADPECCAELRTPAAPEPFAGA